LRFCSFADGGGENLTTSDAHNHRAVGKARSLVGAPLRHADRLRACPLIGVERKGPAHGQSDAIDPMRTLIKVLIGTAVIRLLDKRPCCAPPATSFVGRATLLSCGPFTPSRGCW
jgi:hypothetical protein